MPPRLKHKTFATVGFCETIGAHMPVFEMQARFITRVFTGQVKLPPEHVMLTAIEKKKNMLLERFGKYKNFVS